MSKITQKMVREVKSHNKKTWHDEDWWAFEKRETTATIYYAMNVLRKGASLSEIAEEANRISCVL